MSRMYAAVCVGWILPHPPKGRGWIILQVQTRMGAVQKSQPSIHSVLNTLKFCSPFWCKGSAYKVGKRNFFFLKEAEDMGKNSIPDSSMHVITEIFYACIFKKWCFCSRASKPLAATDHIMCWCSRRAGRQQESTYLVVKICSLSICRSIFLPAINYSCLMLYLIVL